ncbi:hypothetical protein CDD83_8825 [Cordyceps sp. RAO-2017]|nr:hypothetical protein CDD83_8825 [Cordyceps sp. RAO-2017]
MSWDSMADAEGAGHRRLGGKFSGEIRRRPEKAEIGGGRGGRDVQRSGRDVQKGSGRGSEVEAETTGQSRRSVVGVEDVGNQSPAGRGWNWEARTGGGRGLQRTGLHGGSNKLDLARHLVDLEGGETGAKRAREAVGPQPMLAEEVEEEEEEEEEEEMEGGGAQAVGG